MSISKIKHYFIFSVLCALNRPEDVTKLVKKLEQQWRILKSHDLISLTQRDLNTISRQGSNAYFKAMTSAKLARATYKVSKFP